MKLFSYNLDLYSPYSVFNNFARAFPFSSSIYALIFGIIFQNFKLFFYSFGHKIYLPLDLCSSNSTTSCRSELITVGFFDLHYRFRVGLGFS